MDSVSLEILRHLAYFSQLDPEYTSQAMESLNMNCREKSLVKESIVVISRYKQLSGVWLLWVPCSVIFHAGFHGYADTPDVCMLKTPDSFGTFPSLYSDCSHNKESNFTECSLSSYIFISLLSLPISPRCQVLTYLSSLNCLGTNMIVRKRHRRSDCILRGSGCKGT